MEEREWLRETDQRLAHLFEQLEAIQADPSLEQDTEADKPLPFAVYQDLVEAGYVGDRPTMAEFMAYVERGLRAAQRAMRAELAE